MLCCNHTTSLSQTPRSLRPTRLRHHMLPRPVGAEFLGQGPEVVGGSLSHAEDRVLMKGFWGRGYEQVWCKYVRRWEVSRLDSVDTGRGSAPGS